jgi:uncharacterized protein
VGRAQFRFYAELKDFLGPERLSGAVLYEFNGDPALKHAIEAMGVPHTEVDLILVNGENSDFRRVLRDGDRVSVYPVFESIDIGSIAMVRPEPLRDLKFVLDCHLGRLAKYLRILGFDTLYANHAGDRELAEVSRREKRILLTMDRELLKRSMVERGYLVRESDPRRQLAEVLRRFDLKNNIRPLVRCLECNAKLEPVGKADVLDRIPPRVREWRDNFERCPGCGRVYWQGSHYARMRRLVEDIGKSG